MSDLIVTRAEILEQMDKYVRDLGDEDILDFWLQEGIPDGATFDDLLEYAGDENLWRLNIDCFAYVCKWAGVI